MDTSNYHRYYCIFKNKITLSNSIELLFFSAADIGSKLWTGEQLTNFDYRTIRLGVKTGVSMVFGGGLIVGTLSVINDIYGITQNY